LSVTQTRRANAGWTTGSDNFQIYDLTFTNIGSETITFAQFDQGLPVGTPVSYWGLVKTCCTQIDSVASYNITLPSTGLLVGQSLTAGFILGYPSTTALIDPQASTPIVQTEFYNFVVCAMA